MRLYDTMNRRLRSLIPIDGTTFRFYCCGPTVYGPAHIGNFRTFVLQDTLRRALEMQGVKTFHVRNITDVDDKTIRESQRVGQTLEYFTGRWTRRFHRDCEALGCLPPHVEPTATGHIPQQIAMIETLEKEGHAYAGADGSVYFRIASFAEYGRLSRLESRDLELGRSSAARADADEYDKDHVADFVLWKARREEDGPNFWNSPWGEGRPGWHLECSAMIREYLGTDFDMHSGGVDLVFPHHENEIAQSRCACGGQFAAHWFHITHLMVDGGKMSKSLGNLYTLEDLEARGHTAAELRYVLLAGHYRRPLNFMLDSLRDARAALARIGRAAGALRERAGMETVPGFDELAGREVEHDPFAECWLALNEDLNTPETFGRLFTALRGIRAADLSKEEASVAAVALYRLLAALGLDPDSRRAEVEDEAPEAVRLLAAKRWEAKQAKDWAAADTLRDEIAALGWVVKDRRDGFAVERKVE